MTSKDGRGGRRRVDQDLVFTTLDDASRRRILVALEEDQPRWSHEFETDEYRQEGMDREEIAIELHHIHLPRLEEVGFVEWDRATGKLTRGEQFDDLRPYLEFLSDERTDLPTDRPRE